jgi:hypothetical protein
MTLDNPLRVLVEIPAPNVLGDLMNEMRESLDREKIWSFDLSQLLSRSSDLRYRRAPATGVPRDMRRGHRSALNSDQPNRRPHSEDPARGSAPGQRPTLPSEARPPI